MEIRMNGFFFTLSTMLMGVVVVYWAVNGWPQDRAGATALAFILILAWALMFLAVLWGRRVWKNR